MVGAVNRDLFRSTRLPGHLVHSHQLEVTIFVCRVNFSAFRDTTTVKRTCHVFGSWDARHSSGRSGCGCRVEVTG